MAYQHIVVPDGEKITSLDTSQMPNNPIIAFIEGDGIGKDIMTASKRIWDAAVEKAYGGQKKIAWMEIYAGEKAKEIYGKVLPTETVNAIKHFVVAIKGPLMTPVAGGYRSLNVALRQKLDLYACVRPVKYYTGVPTPVKNPEKMNMVIFRENTEDVYAGIEWQQGSAEAKRIIKHLSEKFDVTIREDSGIGIRPL